MALLLVVGCRQEKATLLLVNVEGQEGVTSPKEASKRTRLISKLVTNVVHEEDRIPNILSKGGTPIELPTSFLVRADGRSGPIEVQVQADDERQTLGAGVGTATLEADKQIDLSVMLFPADFGINEFNQGRQFFSTQAGFAREVASAVDGSFVAVWEDYCGPLKRCDIWYRLFDRSGTPKLNSVTGQTAEATANEGNDVYDMPTVAAQESGGFLVAWQRAVGTTMKIYSRTFAPDGRPDPNSNSGSEVELSGTETSTGAIPSVPHAIALRDKTYLVVWQQQQGTTNNWEIKARYLGPNGVPAADYQGSSLPFVVHSFTSSKWPWPMAAPGPNQGFLVVWNEDGLVRGRPYGGRASPLKPAPVDLDAAKTKQVQEVAVSSMPAGYAVAWSDTVGSGPDTDGTCIRLRRLTVDAGPFQPAEVEFTVNTSVAGNQRYPALGTRADGSLLVAWGTEHADPDPEGGIRARKVLHNFLPVGPDFAVNNTQAGKQDKPAVAPHLGTNFIVLFEDNSRAYPDQFESGIRGRIIYPEYATTDGLLGSLCDPVDPGTCGTNLSCQTTVAGSRCVATCATAGAPCVQGGVCKQLSGETAERVCLF